MVDLKVYSNRAVAQFCKDYYRNMEMNFWSHDVRKSGTKSFKIFKVKRVA